VVVDQPLRVHGEQIPLPVSATTPRNSHVEGSDIVGDIGRLVARAIALVERVSVEH
jgi:hypothetical protein